MTSPNPTVDRAYQCGWCPTLLPADAVEWAHHHLVVHGQNGWSVRRIRGGDWDASELTPALEGS